MAKSIKAIVKPEILEWARTSAGFGLSDASRSIKVKEEHLAAWESGKDLPSIPQLRKLAALYKRPLAVFYLQQVPIDFQVLRDLRRLPGQAQRTLSPSLLLEIRRAEQRRELALDLLRDLGEQTPDFKSGATLDENPEVVGERIRSALRVGFDDQVKWRSEDGRTTFNQWRSHIEAQGVLVFQTTRFSTDEASGFAIAENELPVIAVNRQDAPRRRTFSLLHEYAHLMLYVSGVSDAFSEDRRPPEDERIEIFCNRVAAATLMPKSEFLAQAIVAEKSPKVMTWTDAELRELALIFGVSREAALRRLLVLNRTTEVFYREARTRFLAEYRQSKEKQKTEKREMKRNMPQETLSNVGRPLIGMLLESYYATRLTLSDVAGYLGIKTRHIYRLEQVSGVRQV